MEPAVGQEGIIFLSRVGSVEVRLHKISLSFEKGVEIILLKSKFQKIVLRSRELNFYILSDC
jgi:hypothetical protein